MIGVTTISDEIRRAVERSFHESDRDAAFEVLATMRPANHAGLLFQAFGDLGRLIDLVKHYDWRDFSSWFEDAKDDEIIRRRERLGLSLPTHAERRQMRAKEFEEEVIGFIARSLDFPRDELRKSTRLQSDLGINGSAAVEFVHSFAKQFQVDLRSFNADDYFVSNVGEHPVSDFLKETFGGRAQPSKLPITIGSLIRAANEKTWRSAESHGA